MSTMATKLNNPAFDITQRKHGGNSESQEANLAIASTKEKSRQLVYDYAVSCGTHGITADQTAAYFVCTHNHVAPRISELKALRKLLPTAVRRETRSGCFARVLIADQFQETTP